MKRTKKVVLGLAVTAMLGFALAGTARADHRSRPRCYPPPPPRCNYYYSPARHGHYHHYGGYYAPTRRYYYSPPIYSRHYYASPGISFGYSGRNFSFYLGR